MKMRHGKCVVALAMFIPLALAGCVLGVQEDEYADDELVGEAASAITIFPQDFTKVESPSWPKTVTFCLVGAHSGHRPVTWARSWGSPITPPTSTNCLSYTSSLEACNLWVRVDAEGGGHTSDKQYYNLFDQRAPVVAAPPGPIGVGSTWNLHVPGPVGIRHCDGTGIFEWQVKNAGGGFTKIPGSDNLQTFPVQSLVVGVETYRLKSTFKGVVVYSNEVAISWQVLCPGGCTTPPNSCHNPTGICVDGTCEYSITLPGTACNDGRFCTKYDACDFEGYCTGISNCKAGFTCGVGGCEPVNPCGTGYELCGFSCCQAGSNCTLCNQIE